jgi:hypothetical protein
LSKVIFGNQKVIFGNQKVIFGNQKVIFACKNTIFSAVLQPLKILKTFKRFKNKAKRKMKMKHFAVNNSTN